jgi:hypothetical protein
MKHITNIFQNTQKIKEDMRVNQEKVYRICRYDTGFTTVARVNFRIKHNDNFFDFHKIKQPSATALPGEDKKKNSKKKCKSFLIFLATHCNKLEHCGSLPRL